MSVENHALLNDRPLFCGGVAPRSVTGIPGSMLASVTPLAIASCLRRHSSTHMIVALQVWRCCFAKAILNHEQSCACSALAFCFSHRCPLFLHQFSIVSKQSFSSAADHSFFLAKAPRARPSMVCISSSLVPADFTTWARQKLPRGDRSDLAASRVRVDFRERRGRKTKAVFFFFISLLLVAFDVESIGCRNLQVIT